MQVIFVYLKVGEEHLQARVKARVGHYMKESMVRCQMEILEEPAQDESDVIKIDVQREQDVVRRDALARVRGKLMEYEAPTINGHGI